MPFGMSRRQFVLLSGLTLFAGCGYGLVRGVRSVRNAARRMSED